ncbi:ferredoxin-type protein NapF [Sansalvadorimonas verongulae]|uniref:ferredoxin-type protein NapF n=1 Tax=Sansalvadorimonas verongulae TaxID=2172824 RepID=UPI0038B62A8B|nr:ferredoxin-type protein NapF [Sansalvadorimonas verongulae]
MIDRTRRNLLRGILHPSTDAKTAVYAPLYPPWSLPAEDFLNACTRCGNCIRQCPESIITTGDGGFPEVNFHKGECTFCGECVSACQAGALIKQHPSQKPWTYIAHIKDNCLALNGVTCSRCADECESNAIKLNYSVLGISTPSVNSESCTGCGACVSVCPVNAIEDRANGNNL